MWSGGQPCGPREPVFAGINALPAPGPLCLAETVMTSTDRLVDTNGVALRVTEAGDRGAPLVVLAHGFPELAYSWRRQIPALAAAGYHVLAPDQRGYGGSSRPTAVEDYNIAALCGDIEGLLDYAGADRAVIVGHDWGAIVAWTFPLLHPDRVAGVAGLSLPPIPRPPAPPVEIWRRRFGEHFFYILYFQEPGVADADLARDVRETLRRLVGGPAVSGAGSSWLATPGPDGWVSGMPGPAALPEWLPEEEFEHYVGEFSRTGFTGGLNWYRNYERNWELTAHPPATTITAPALYLAGTADPIQSFTPTVRVAEVVKGEYREVMIEGAGHWLQQERPDEVNAALLGFLSGLELR